MQETLPKTWRNAWNRDLLLKKMKLELANEYALFYGAFNEGQLIAYLKLNLGPAQMELKDPAGLEIERIYVLQAFQGTGVGH